jgi:predicted metal-dependent peptidase
MAPYVAFLYGALTALRHYVERDVFLFSTSVHPIRMEDLRRGRLDTTGGTDLGCVLQHALLHRLRKVLIITDGYVGKPTAARAAALRQSGLELRVVLTPQGWRKDLEDVAARMDELPALTHAQRLEKL